MSTTTQPAKQPALLRFFGGLLGLIAVAVATICLFAIPLVSFLLLDDPFVIVPLLIGLGLVTLLAGTYVLRQSAIANRDKAIEKVRMQAISDTVDPELEKMAHMPIPSYGAMLKRYTLITLVFMPVLVLLSVLAQRGLFSAFDASTQMARAQNRSGAKLLITTAAGGLLLGWLFGAGRSWKLISGWVDRRILRQTFELPESDEVHQKRLMRERAAAAQAQQGWTTRLKNMAQMLGMFILMPVVIVGPAMLVALLGMNNVLPPALIMILLFCAALLWPVFLLMMMPLFITRVLPRRIQKKTEEALETARQEATTDEERAEVDKALVEMKKTQAVQQDSIEARVGSRFLMIMGGFVGAIIVIPVIMAMIAMAMGADKSTGDNIRLAGMVVGTACMFLFFKKMPARFLPKSRAEELLVGLEDMLRTGKNRDAVALVDHAMQEFPSWEVMIPAAATYANAGYLGKAEELSYQAIKECSQGTSDMEQAMAKAVLGNMYGLLIEVALLRGDYAQAETLMHKADEFTNEGYPYANTKAHLYLRMGQPDKALEYIHLAVKEYKKANKPVSGMNLAYHAWAKAQQGDVDAMKALFKEAVEAVDPANKADLAEVHVIGGLIAQHLRKPASAAKRFETAIQLTPNGIYGHLARVGLEQIA